MFKGFGKVRKRLNDFERKVRSKERMGTEKFYLEEINKQKRTHLAREEYLFENYRKDLVKVRQEERERYEKKLNKLRDQLHQADKKLKNAQDAYESYRDFQQRSLELARDLRSEVEGIFMTTGDLSRRFNAIQDRLEAIDRLNIKKDEKIVNLLDMKKNNLLLCVEKK